MDKKPTISWTNSVDADLVVHTDHVSGEGLTLKRINNPFGLSLLDGCSLNSELAENPVKGGELLDRYVSLTKAAIASATSSGVDGIWYELHGAAPTHCTPMQYGGFYLERDREILASTPFAVLFVVGSDEPYFDFICDLPAQVIAWDSEATGVSSVSMRAMRPGAQCSSDADSEILLDHAGIRLADQLEKPIVETV